MFTETYGVSPDHSLLYETLRQRESQQEKKGQFLLGARGKTETEAQTPPRSSAL
ncbi:hypothetical protein [Nostoc sp. ChiVER01]|uniref:hypothetical protein n=1 Tax=Nostoc sp. ChiVER01 TaxID=3075382 RepID=UPI002AD33966|nr:hypothetical protein [Nostoc sp. ChiVER01]MDZ8222813.1 hypothetical protein [Nostoc sp. ChiVER01]